MANDTQKITAHLPRKLLEEAQTYTGAGITETLRIALERMAEAEHKSAVYKELMALRGTHKFAIDLKELREDRDEPWLDKQS